MSRITAVGISEGDFAELLFPHINDLVVWNRLMLVSKRFCQASKKLIKIIYEEASSTIYKKREIKFPDGHSFKKTWYDNGLIRSTNCFLNNILHGPSTLWYDNGNIMYETNWLNAEKHGVCKGWYYNGHINYEFNYLNGKRNGVCKEWHYINNRVCEYNMLNDKRHGVRREWNFDGDLLLVENYIMNEHTEIYFMNFEYVLGWSHEIVKLVEN